MSFGFARRAWGLQVDTNRVDAGLDHPKRDLACLRGGALVWHHDVGKDKSRQFGARASELIAHGADRLRRIRAGESEEIKDVAAAGEDAARLAGTAVHGLHVCQQESVGKPLAEGGYDVRNALGFEQRRPHFDDVDSTRQRGTGDRQSEIQGPHVDRNLKRKAGLEPVHNAGGTRVCLLRRRLAPGGSGPYRLEDGADGQTAAGEPTSGV
jgi:hypothetical protein